MVDIGIDRPPRALILPGRIPKHEIEVARTVLDAEPFAIDLDPVAIAAARDAGVDGCVMDLSSVLVGPGRRERTMDPRIADGFEFINLDTCSLVTSSVPDVARMLNRAMQLSRLVALWCSYGHEQDMTPIYETANRLATGLPLRWGHWIELKREHLASIPETIWMRVVYLMQRAQCGGVYPTNIVKVWSYGGITKGVGAMPMFVVMFRVGRGSRPGRARTGEWWIKGKTFPEQTLVPYERIVDREYRQCVLGVADESSTEMAARLYGLSADTVAAWKAVRTRKERRVREYPAVRS